MIKFDLDESKTECKDAVIWCFGHSNVIFNKFAKIQKYCKYKNFNVIKVFGSFSQNKDTEKAEFNEMLDFIMHQKQKIAVVIHDSNQFPKFSNSKSELMDLVSSGKIELYFASGRMRLSNKK